MQLQRQLEQLGHVVVLAENGRQALEILSAGGFDLVLLDILMPEMDGFQVLERLKADPVQRELPVIVISALDEMDSVIRCIGMGAEDFLPKPFNPLLLRARLDACLEKKRMRDQEIEYLQQVATVTAAAAAVEEGHFAVASLDGVAARSDELGQLGRVFQRMAKEVYTREQLLKQQLLELRIQIDEAKRERDVADITETEYFQQLREKASKMRKMKAEK